MPCSLILRVCRRHVDFKLISASLDSMSLLSAIHMTLTKDDGAAVAALDSSVALTLARAIFDQLVPSGVNGGSSVSTATMVCRGAADLAFGSMPLPRPISCA
jgi:hypothetical protein